MDVARTHPRQSTDFSFSRFLVPYLCNYRDWAIYLDCDMLCLGDIAGLYYHRDYTKAVHVVRHDYTPDPRDKFTGQRMQQTVYPRKNWSSVMLFNNSGCQRLTPRYINSANGLELHQFAWLHDESMIGPLPKKWNHLVGEYPYREDAQMVHCTRGMPYVPGFEGCDFAALWRLERQGMLYESSREGAVPADSLAGKAPQHQPA
jgi:lipopolysaccharide biosynthesis glycosyltransferase